MTEREGKFKKLAERGQQCHQAVKVSGKPI